MTTQKFKKILRQIHNGNTQALSYIYGEYYEKMVISAMFILKNTQDAEDAAANVILKILNMALRNENVQIENVGAYINVSIKNEAINIYNKRKNLVSDGEIAEAGETCFEFNRTLEKDVIARALKSLPALERDIAMLFYFYDYKIREITSYLNVPEGTVKWKLNNIRKKLQEIIK